MSTWTDGASKGTFYNSDEVLEKNQSRSLKTSRTGGSHSESVLLDDSGGQGRHASVSELLRWWHIEVLSCIVLLGVLVALIITVAQQEGKPVSTWRLGLNINGLIAIFSIIIKATSALILSEGLGQLKWTWFRSTHKLSAFAEFDKASRGPWGSLSLLIRLRGRPLLASFGAIIVLATLIAEPFAQQLINFADCTIPVASGNSSALRTGYYMALANANSENLSYDVNLPNAIRRAIFGGDTEGFGVPPNCSSGNCTFDPFYTVGYCSSCDDISGQIRLENSAFTIDPQNNASIPVTEPSEDSIAWDFYSRRFYHNVTYWLPKSFNQQYRPLSISNLPRSCPRQGKEVCEQYQPSFMALGTNGQGGQNFSVLAGFLQGVNSSNPTFPFNTKPIRPNIQQECNAKHSQDWFCQTRGAASCALFPCVRKLLVSVTNGSLNETVLEKIPMPIRYFGMTTASTVANEDCLRQHQNETVIAKGKRSSANAKWLEYPHTSLNNKSEIISDPSTNPSMPGFSTGSPSDQGEPFMLAAECAFGIHFLAVTKLQSYLTAFLTGDVTAQTWQPDLAIPSLASSRDRLAVDQFYQGGNVTFETVANKFESIADSMTAQIRRDGANSVSSDPALGVITTNRTCIRVRWAWMVYPCILAALVSTFLIAVIIEGARSDRMGWKTSILPVLFHGLETPPQDVAQTLNDEKDMKKGASSISVRLARSAQGWKLVESRTDKE